VRSGRGRRRFLLIAAGLLTWGAIGFGHAADDVGRLIDALRGGRTFKVRVQAAAALARMPDRRVVIELGRAAVEDRHPTVRGYALRLLGKVRGDGEAVARAAIRRALGDRRSEVRTVAQQVLAALDQRGSSGATTPSPPIGRPGEVMVAVRGMGDRTGRASAALKTALRAAIVSNLQRERGVRIVADDAAASYAIDGSIARLLLNTGGMDVESTVGVELVVSRPPRGIVLIASGEAAVTEPRTSFRPDRRAGLEATALEHAVKSAHENLARFLANAR
jgi:hypothetical protein